MRKLKIVGGTKYKKEIDPKHYISAENLLNTIFSVYDLIWLDAIRKVEEKLNGEDTFSDSFIGTTSMNEVSEELNNFLIERKKIINQLVEKGNFDTERKFLIFPREDESTAKGLSMVFEIKFNFDLEKEIFSFDSDMKLDISEKAVEKYQLVKDEIIKIVEMLKGKDLQALYDYSVERHKYYMELNQTDKPDA